MQVGSHHHIAVDAEGVFRLQMANGVEKDVDDLGVGKQQSPLASGASDVVGGVGIQGVAALLLIGGL